MVRSLQFRRDYGITWDWEQQPGVPKPGYYMDGEKQSSPDEPLTETAVPP